MRNILFLPLLILVTGCSTVPESATSELVLMAAANKINLIDANITNTHIPFNITCGNVNGNKLDYKEVISKVTKEAIAQKTGFTSEQIKEAAKLLSSGQFRTDIQSIVVLAVSTMPNFAQTLPQSSVEIQNKIKSLKSETPPENINKCIEDILEKESCSDKLTLHDLFNDLYHNPSNELIKETFLSLLNNQSFRLALIVYAHSNGVDIAQEDLNFVQNQLRKPDIDIKALRGEGENRLKEKYKIDEVKTKIDALNSRCK